MHADVIALRKKIEKVEQDLCGSLTAQAKQTARNDIGIIFRDASILVNKITEEVLKDDPDNSVFDEEDFMLLPDAMQRAQLLKSAIECLI